jgi:multidrug transporter EmrE-like cation transporter
MIEMGLLLALACALLSNVALLCKYRGANQARDVRFGRPLRSAASLFASKWWTIGFVVAFVAWGLHVAALTMAPLSVVQAVIAGGIALLAIPARHMFGISLGWRELLGLALSAVGLAFLALTAVDHPTGGSEYSTTTMAAFQGGAIAIGLALLFSGARGEGRRHGGLMLGASAGLLIGVSDVAIKALAEVVPGSPVAILSPWTLVAAIAAVAAFYALARSLQLGDPVEVIVVSSVAANCAAIVGGVLVFGDPVGSDALGVIARSAAFAAVIAAAALIPAPRPSAAPRHA